MIFWMLYHYGKYRCLPEPRRYLAAAFVLGAGSFYLGISMYWLLDFVDLRLDAYGLAETNKPGLFVYSILVIGLIEELAKIIPFLLVVIHFKYFDTPMDGIIYASFIALGFALVENFYHVQYVTLYEAWARGFAGPMIHVVFASVWGYYIGRAHLGGKPIVRVAATCLAFTAILHGVYDYVAISMPMPSIPIAAALIVGIWIWRLCVMRDLFKLESGPCPPELEK